MDLMLLSLSIKLCIDSDISGMQTFRYTKNEIFR